MVQIRCWRALAGTTARPRAAWHRRPGAPDRRAAEAAPEPAPGIECYHVNARMSRQLEDIGDMRIGKLFSLLGYCAEAIWCHYRYGVTISTTSLPPANARPSIATGWSCCSAGPFSGA